MLSKNSEGADYSRGFLVVNSRYEKNISFAKRNFILASMPLISRLCKCLFAEINLEKSGFFRKIENIFRNFLTKNT